MMDSPKDMHRKWLLEKITKLEGLNNPHRWPTHRNIWAGCYDVVLCAQDDFDNVEIPKACMKAAEEDGHIKSEVRRLRDKYDQTVWILTESGKAFLNG
jgi:hypothetical protein